MSALAHAFDLSVELSYLQYNEKGMRTDHQNDRITAHYQQYNRNPRKKGAYSPVIVVAVCPLAPELLFKNVDGRVPFGGVLLQGGVDGPCPRQLPLHRCEIG